MKASDICVGDWVMVAECIADAHFRHYPDKVESISKDLVGLASNGSETILDRINPIPLTEEILVKNGFENVRDNLVFTLKNLSSNVRIGITLDNESTVYLSENKTGVWPGFNYYDLFEINSVHQLQHLLRLMGVQKEIEL